MTKIRNFASIFAMNVSIVIPTKNEEKNLPNLLRSIRGQSFRDYEIIVADAKSSDATRQIAASFGARVVEGGMPGPGRNRGAEAAEGDVLMFFDADVILPHASFVEDCMHEMATKKFDVTTCRVFAYQGSMIDQAMHEAYNVYTLATEKVLPHAAGFCMFATRDAHRAIGGFDEEVVFAEDHDYVRRAKKAGFAFGILRKHKIPVSVRRLDKEGRALLTAKYLYSELHMLTRGPFKKMPFTYEMGGDAPTPPKE